MFAPLRLDHDRLSTRNGRASIRHPCRGQAGRGRDQVVRPLSVLFPLHCAFAYPSVRFAQLPDLGPCSRLDTGHHLISFDYGNHGHYPSFAFCYVFPHHRLLPFFPFFGLDCSTVSCARSSCVSLLPRSPCASSSCDWPAALFLLSQETSAFSAFRASPQHRGGIADEREPPPTTSCFSLTHPPPCLLIITLSLSLHCLRRAVH